MGFFLDGGDEILLVLLALPDFLLLSFSHQLHLLGQDLFLLYDFHPCCQFLVLLSLSIFLSQIENYFVVLSLLLSLTLPQLLLALDLLLIYLNQVFTRWWLNILLLLLRGSELIDLNPTVALRA